MARQFTVRPHRPWRHGLTFVVALAVLGTGVWLAFERGRLQAGHDRESWLATEQGLLRQIEELEQRNTELLQHNARLERSADVDRNAYRELQRTLTKAQHDSLELSEQLSFYRGLVMPAGKDEGLHVERLELNPTGRSSMFSYRMTLIQVRRNDRFATGKVDFSVSGMRAGEQLRIPFKELDPSASAIEFKFKYFQDFEGTIELPENFDPAHVLVRVKPNEKRLERVDIQFEWHAVVTGGS